MRQNHPGADHRRGDAVPLHPIFHGSLRREEIRAVNAEARDKRLMRRKKAVLLVDEIHRFNTSRRDAFLHHVENGLITPIGAVAENPSSGVTPVLLSRRSS